MFVKSNNNNNTSCNSIQRWVFIISLEITVCNLTKSLNSQYSISAHFSKQKVHWNKNALIPTYWLLVVSIYYSFCSSYKRNLKAILISVIAIIAEQWQYMVNFLCDQSSLLTSVVLHNLTWIHDIWLTLSWISTWTLWSSNTCTTLSWPQ